MKSAYEIAMEKLKAEAGETRTLTEDEKRRCAEIDNACEAKIAEARLGFDTKMAIYDGGDACDICTPTDAPLGCDDDFCGVNLGSQVTVPVIDRQCYLIRIGSFSPSVGVGSGTLSLSCVVPPPPTGACCATSTCLGTLTEPTCTSSGGTLWVEGEGCPAFACPTRWRS